MTDLTEQVPCAFALLIGINDYRAYDASAKLAPGTHDLPAGRNDVETFFRTCRRLGIPPANIHVLVSSVVGQAGPGEAAHQAPLRCEDVGYLGAATRAEIEAQLGWLASQLAHPRGDKDAPVGLLTYSGHGDFLGGELAICPSDVRVGKGDDLDGVIALREIQDILARSPGAPENLTVVLDCCHAAASGGTPGGARRSSLTGRPSPTSKPSRLGARLFLAAAPEQSAYQSEFDGSAHSALSWAINLVLEQWRVVPEGDVNQATITHRNLLTRTQNLLDALGFAQRVSFYPSRSLDTPFFHRGAAHPGDDVSQEPDGPRQRCQVDPTWRPPGASLPDWVLYKFHGANARKLGAVLSARTDAPAGLPRYKAGTEYWNIGPTPDLFDSVDLVVVTGMWSSPPGFPYVPNLPDVYETRADVTSGDWSPTNHTVPAGALWGTTSPSANRFAFTITWSSGLPTWHWHEFSTAATPLRYAMSGPSSLGTTPLGTSGYNHWAFSSTGTVF